MKQHFHHLLFVTVSVVLFIFITNGVTKGIEFPSIDYASPSTIYIVRICYLLAGFIAIRLLILVLLVSALPPPQVIIQ